MILILLLGLFQLGYSFYVKISLNSRESVWTNNLSSAANGSNNALAHTFQEILDSVQGDWTSVIISSLLVLISSAFLWLNSKSKT